MRNKVDRKRETRQTEFGKQGRQKWRQGRQREGNKVGKGKETRQKEGNKAGRGRETRQKERRNKAGKWRETRQKEREKPGRQTGENKADRLVEIIV